MPNPAATPSVFLIPHAKHWLYSYLPHKSIFPAHCDLLKYRIHFPVFDIMHGFQNLSFPDPAHI